MKNKIGILGNGFVGNSIAFGFSPTHEIRVHDKDTKRNLNTIEEVLECDFVFVAVPTPMNGDGTIDDHEKQVRMVEANSNFLGQNLPNLHFGLGSATVIEELTVLWPLDSTPLVCNDVEVNRFVVLDHRARLCP